MRESFPFLQHLVWGRSESQKAGFFLLNCSSHLVLGGCEHRSPAAASSEQPSSFPVESTAVAALMWEQGLGSPGVTSGERVSQGLAGHAQDSPRPDEESAVLEEPAPCASHRQGQDGLLRVKVTEPQVPRTASCSHRPTEDTETLAPGHVMREGAGPCRCSLARVTDGSRQPGA